MLLVDKDERQQVRDDDEDELERSDGLEQGVVVVRGLQRAEHQLHHSHCNQGRHDDLHEGQRRGEEEH